MTAFRFELRARRRILRPHGAALMVALTACGSDPRQETPTDGTTGVGDDGATGDGTTADDGDADTGDQTKLDVGSGDTGTDDPGGFDCESIRDSNLGCEFWAVDLPNVSVANALSVAPHDQPFAVVVSNASADVPATVSVFSGAQSSPIETASVPVDGVHTFSLPTQNIMPAATTSNGEAFRIESDIPITAYQFQPLDNTNPVYSNDATILFPTHVLTGNYTAITADATITSNDGFNVSNDNTGGFVSVVATEDDTAVTVFPTQALYPGTHQDVSLSRGQVLTAIASELREAGNLSGTRVQADKPVAVFSGVVAAAEPTSADKCCADHVEHQMLPLEAWGTAYAAAPPHAARDESDHPAVYRIIGGYDGTKLEYQPVQPDGAPSVVGAYEMVAFQTDLSFTVRTTDSDKPFAIAQFLLSNKNFGGLTYPGDPSMLLLPAADQFQPEYVFSVPAGYNSNYVTIVRPTGADISLDGQMVETSFRSLGTLGGELYEYGHVSVMPGHHGIRSNDPFAISVMGYSDDVSFGYTGGSGVKEISEPPPPVE